MNNAHSITNLVLKIVLVFILMKVFILILPINNSTRPFKIKIDAKVLTTKTVEKKDIDLINKIPQKIYGIDVSHYRLNELINTSQLDSISFVFIKATEGKNYINPNFYKEWNVAIKNKLYKGAYHFYRDKIDPMVQADYFYSKIKTVLDSTSLPVVLDVEKESFSSKKHNTPKNQKAVLECLKRIEELTDKTPIIYTNTNFGKHFFTDSTFSKYPLWIADYSEKEKPKVPNIWKNDSWLFWQKSSNYKIDSTNVDLDVFNGSLKDLKKLTK